MLMITSPNLSISRSLAARIYSVIRRKQFGNVNIVELNERSKINLPGKTVTVITIRPVTLTRQGVSISSSISSVTRTR